MPRSINFMYKVNVNITINSHYTYKYPIKIPVPCVNCLPFIYPIKVEKKLPSRHFGLVALFFFFFFQLNQREQDSN